MWLLTLILVGLLAVWPSGAIAAPGAAVYPSTTASALASTPSDAHRYSTRCIAWKLVTSKQIGEGWSLTSFCKNDNGQYGWDHGNLLDDCLGVDLGGHLQHNQDGDMSKACYTCNNNDDWGHTSANDHTLFCNCTNTQGTLVESSIDLDNVYGYNGTDAYCLDYSGNRDLSAEPSSAVVHPRGQAWPSIGPDPSGTPDSIGTPTFDGRCFGIQGNRGLAPPAHFRRAEDSQLAARSRPCDHEPSADPPSQFDKELIQRSNASNPEHCCWYDSCQHPATLRQPEPWLYTRCRRVGEVTPLLHSRFDLSRAFTYDKSDWTIKPGTNLYNDGKDCKDCHGDESWLVCQCINATAQWQEKTIDLDRYISNINGTLCSKDYCGDHENPTAPLKLPLI